MKAFAGLAMLALLAAGCGPEIVPCPPPTPTVTVTITPSVGPTPTPTDPSPTETTTDPVTPPATETPG